MTRPTEPNPAAWNDLVVVELEGSVAGAFCAKLLADLGADVRTMGGPTTSMSGSGPGLGLYLGADKRRVERTADAAADDWSTLDPHAPALVEADVLIRSAAPDPLTVWPGVDEARPSARIDVEISPFGRAGPNAQYRSADLTDQAVSGHLFLNGDPDRPPIRGPEHQVAYAAGLHAAIGVGAAIVARHRNGQGQRVEVTHHEVMVALHQFTLLRYTHNGDVLGRMGNRYAGPGNPIGAYHCGDRMISLVVPRDDQLDRLLGLAGLDHLLEHPGIESTYDLMHHPTLLNEHLRPWLAAQDHDETIELLQALRIPAGPVSSMADLLADEHLTARGFWRRIETGPNIAAEPGTVSVPGRPFRITEADPDLDPAPAVAAGASARRDRWPSSANKALVDGPLTGYRVLDLTRVWAGPLATRILADLGADVIMVEAPWARGPAGIDRSSVLATHYYPDDEAGEHHRNRIGFINKFGLNKRGLALDLTDAGGRSAFEAMVTEADVVIENYSPRVMPQLGFSEERLHQLNPSLVYVTMPGFGRSGPATERVAYGPMIDSHAGLSVLAGYPDDSARKGGVAWPDPVAGLHAALATLGALAAGLHDGAGRTVEVAQLEASVSMVGHALADAQLAGREPALIGNRDPHHAPQGVYPSAGSDSWLALTVTDDAGWSGLCRIAGLHPSWVDWTRHDRHRGHDDIDRALSAWTSGFDCLDLVDRLQSLGVAAAAVATAPMVMDDQHLRARGIFVPVEHPEAGLHEWAGLAIGLSETPATYRRAAPMLNEHGDEVLRTVAGLDQQAIDDLYSSGALSDRPPD